MSKPKHDPVREDRILMEIVVDAYDEFERATAWHCYLDQQLKPFNARCIETRQISPLEEDDEVYVLGTADDEECEHEMFVLVHWDDDRELAVPLSQLEPIDADEQTQQAVDDWHYWVRMGYQF